MKFILLSFLIIIISCSTENENIVWDYLKEKGFSDAGASGLMGNLKAISGLESVKYDDSYKAKLGLTDQEYVDKVNKGIYKDFIYDSVGFGIANWTYWTRKQALLEECKVNIGDLVCQLDFLMSELKTNYPKLVRILKSSTDVNTCSTEVLISFVMPKEQSNNIKNNINNLAKTIYDQFYPKMKALNVNKLKKYKTPFYYYDTSLLHKTISSCLSTANSNNIKIHFSLKSNFNEKILQIFSSYSEIGADCVSGGEVKLALKYFPPKEIVFAGIGKTDEEIEFAVENEIFCLNVESLEELENLNEIAKKKKKKINFATRINPNVLAHTNEKITTGLNENKFGIYLDEFEDVYYNKIKDVYFNKDNKYEYINFIGLHFHIGSQILDFNDYLPLCKKIDEMIEKLNSMGVYITYLNLGGGLGVDYENPTINSIPDFNGFFNTYLNHIRSLKRISQNFNGNKQIKLHFELGRSMICQSGNLIAKVNYIKKGIEKSFLILDAGMNDLIRPAMYGALHQIEKIGKYDELEKYDVVGPICESSDVFAKNYTMGKCQKGDYVVIRSAGAYGESMASRYNYRDIPKGYLDTEF